MTNITILFGDKIYVGNIDKELRAENGIRSYALKRGNSKEPLPKAFRNRISKLGRRIESTFNQLIEHFNIEKVRVNSFLSLQTMLEMKFLFLNILALIRKSTAISNVLNFD